MSFIFLFSVFFLSSEPSSIFISYLFPFYFVNFIFFFFNGIVLLFFLFLIFPLLLLRLLKSYFSFSSFFLPWLTLLFHSFSSFSSFPLCLKTCLLDKITHTGTNLKQMYKTIPSKEMQSIKTPMKILLFAERHERRRRFLTFFAIWLPEGFPFYIFLRQQDSSLKESWETSFPAKWINKQTHK